MKYIALSIIFILSITNATLFAKNDSTLISDLSQKINLLENKLEILNDTNDKLITICWAVIGIIVTFFAVVIGLNFWSNFKLNKQKIENLESELKIYLESELFESYKTKLNETIKSKINSEISSIKNENTQLKNEIRKLKIELILNELGNPLPKIHDPLYHLRQLLKLNVEIEQYHGMDGNSVGVHDSLNLILEHVKENEIDIDEKKWLFESIHNLNERYKFHVSEIEKNIKIKH